MEIAEWLFNGVLIFLGIQFLLGPVIVWRSQKMPEYYRFNIIESQKFLSERSPTFIALHKTIQGSGFEYTGSSELLMSNLSMYFSLYNHFDKKIACTLVTAHSKPVNTTHIEFTQMYEDGSVLNVSNASVINVYPRSVSRLSFRFPRVNEFGQLLALAERLIRNHKQGERRITFKRGQEFEALESYLNRELKELIARGWVRSDVVAGQRRLTIKGATLMTWKMLWPVRQILSNIDISRSRRAAGNA